MNTILLILSILFSVLLVIYFKTPQKKHIVILISRIFTGFVFIFSGFVKAVDPMGYTIKITDYFNAFGMESFSHYAFAIALFFSAMEFITGFALMFNLKIKFFSKIALLFMIFFTPLTLYLAIANPVSDCGCFGDALVITNWQTFWKNLIIIVPVFIIYINRNKIETNFSQKSQFITILSAAIGITAFSVYCDQHLPVIDFRPYKIGNNITALQKEIYELDENIPEEKAILDKVPIEERYDSILTTFIYKKDGVLKEFNDIPEDTNWQWVETKNIVIKEGYHPPIHDFSITDLNGTDITKQILNDTSYSFLIISYKIDKADFNGIKKAVNLSLKMKNNKFYFLTASLDDDIKKLKDTLITIFKDKIETKQETIIETIYYYEKDGEVIEFSEDELPVDDSWQYIDKEEITISQNNSPSLPFDFYTTDETTLKTIIRSNPGLVLIKKGTIINKWASVDIPDTISF